MNRIISKYDINHFLIWSGIQTEGLAQRNVSTLLSVSSQAQQHILRSNIVQSAHGQTVQLTQHTAFQLTRRSITMDLVRQAIENPDEVCPDSLDNTRKIYQIYLSLDKRLNIMVAKSTGAARLVVGAWVGPV